MALFARFFGLVTPTPKVTTLIQRIVLLMPTMAMTFTISTTFWMIYIAESLGGGDYILGLERVGLLVIIQLVVQTFLDYPSGAVGDKIGQRWVLASALLCFSLAYWLTSLVDTASPYEHFILIYALNGLGQSQQSGAVDAWFDNNYRVAMPHDSDRKQYGKLKGRMAMVYEIISTLILLPGAWLAMLYSRQWVFKLQAVACVLLAFAVLKAVRDFPETEEIRKKENGESGSYAGILADGVRFVFSSRFVALVILGDIVLFCVGNVWWQLLLFPMYFIYLLTDVAVAGYRTLVFVPNAVAQERSGFWSARFDPIKWVPRFRLVQFGGVAFFVLLAATTLFWPPPNPATAELLSVFIPFTQTPLFQVPVDSVPALVVVFIVFTAGDFFGAFAEVLEMRVIIDVVPNRIRNSLYSLRPALTIIASIPVIYAFSFILPMYGFAVSFAICSMITLVGTLMIWKGYRYPIPRAQDLSSIRTDSEYTSEV
ncbi:MAG: MFS transporter [Candidatus Thorarchaeota archaeon]|nr:MFS transporter [Candidatus Thorarchaeota archaeon]